MLEGRYLVLIEDDALMGHSLVQRLELVGAEVTWLKQASRGMAAVRTPRRPVDAVICDIRLPDGSGEDVFNAVARCIAPPPFLFITGQGDIDQAVRLLRGGASDFMTKPFEMADFLDRLALILRPDMPDQMPPQTGVSPLARQVDALVEDFARHDRPVLIRGGRGLGKAGLARRLHDLSDRRAAPFVTLNTFRGETGAKALAAALEAAADGTLFVHGVEGLDAEAQEDLAHALETAAFRLVASCLARLDRPDSGPLRSDLLYPLAAGEIVVPPLAQRPEDAVWLAWQVFRARNTGRPVPLKGISDRAALAIRDHDWPGNGRELRSRLLRAIDAAEGDRIFPADIFPEINSGDHAVHTLAEARERAERRQIIEALERTGGQIAAAARLLDVSRTTLWEKMQKLGL